MKPLIMKNQTKLSKNILKRQVNSQLNQTEKINQTNQQRELKDLKKVEIEGNQIKEELANSP